MKDNTPRSVFIIVRRFIDAQAADESGMFSSVPIWELWRVARTNMAAPLTCGRADNEASRYLLCLWWHVTPSLQSPSKATPPERTYAQRGNTRDNIKLLHQRFPITVLAPSRSAHFICISYHVWLLFYSTVSHKCPAKWTSPYTPPWFQFKASVCSILQRAIKCARREFKLYLFTEVYYVTLL